jgi:hypothetical protein
MARPEATRAQDEVFIQQCSFTTLRRCLPLIWPKPVDTPTSPKLSYRSYYQYLGWEELENPGVWQHCDDFELLLRLVDFSPLRDVLAERLGWTSAQGQVPFDPVSFCLLTFWQINNGWSRAETLRNLCKERYADYARLFGFREGEFPSEGGLRYFLTTLGKNSTAPEQVVPVQQGEKTSQIAVQQLNQLLAQTVQLIRDSNVLTPAAWEKALLCPDGQIHNAASRLRCQHVTESCYQPAPRPCPAREKGFQGCDCDTPRCAMVCKRATPQDREARFVWYTGDNQDDEKAGEAFYGYRSLPLQLVAPQRRFSLTLLDDLLPANQREEVPATALLLQLEQFYPDLQIDAVAGDAGYGYQVFLHTVYDHLGARRVINIRHHETDENEAQWILRGYDNKGRPICPFGCSLTFFGFDYQRQRSKWVCEKTCIKENTQPKFELPDITFPPSDCPYLSEEHLHGRCFNLGERFPDGSIRLARDLPVGGPSWKKLYHRARNAVEGRNATFEAWGFKRLPVYGLSRVTTLIFLADVLNNLTTMARLICEATLAQHQT